MENNNEVIKLPDVGTDWLRGLENQYIILSLKLSTSDYTMFWRAGGFGYCSNLIEAGRFSKEEVLKNPYRYNDGVNAVAVPLTEHALTVLGLLPHTFDYTMLNVFMNRRVTEPE